MAGKQEDYGKLKERLRSGKLKPEDIKKLEEIISRVEQPREGSGSLGSVGGRPILVRLPGGLDLIK
jgi:hypothetical protein